MDRRRVIPEPTPPAPVPGAGGGPPGLQGGPVGGPVGGTQSGSQGSVQASLQASPQGGAGSGLLFLREEQMRLAQDMFFLAYRDLSAAADVILEELELGRAHHRALHFIGRRPGIAVNELLAVLRITKQSLARVLGELVARGLVSQSIGPTDRRQRLLKLTGDGQALERRLFEQQRGKLVFAYREAGGVAVEGFRRVMRGVMDDETRRLVEPAELSPPLPAPLRQMNR